MPGKPRCQIVDQNEIGFYHCQARCVRRAFLYGDDPYSGKNYDHRKGWVRQKLVELASIFAIEVCWYALLDNHLHVILRSRPDLADKWSEREVIRRACRLFPKKFEEMGVLDGRPTPKQLQSLVQDKRLVKRMRKRLRNISWFMGRLCQWIAKKANREDDVTGHFFEDRFKCSRILDEIGLLICAMYVDLNWIRADKAQTPETSQYTSAHDRILGRKARRRRATKTASGHDGWLAVLSLSGDVQHYPPGQRASNKGLLPMSLEEYLQLLDWTGRRVHPQKRGKIPGELPPILERLGIQEKAWVACISDFTQCFKTAVGTVASLTDFAQKLGQQWLHGMRRCRRAFSPESNTSI